MKHKISTIFTILFIAIAYGAIMRIFNITCPIKFLFGVSCPGCGMTRAVIAMLQFDFISAMDYHPLCFSLIPYLVILCFFYIKDNKKGFRAVLTLGVVLLIFVYIYRLFYVDQSIVVFSPKDGFFAQLFFRIKDSFN